MSHALTSCFASLSHKHQSLSHKRQLELFHEVLACHRYIDNSYQSWENVFPDNVVSINIEDINTSPLFFISIKIHDITDEAVIGEMKKCPTMTAEGLGLRGKTPQEVAFLNDCWNSTLSKALSLRRRAPMPASA
jgi:hypothetical protein